MLYSEVNGDLFSAGNEYFLVHCISSDFAMGAGIAKEFTTRGVKRYLQENYLPSWNGVGYAILAPLLGFQGVYNLVTKGQYWHKPTIDTLYQALYYMKQYVKKGDKLAMPKIGCGLDRLSWCDVKACIDELFGEMDIEIKVFSLS